MKTLGLYVHIPFCVQKCLYCDFLSAPASKEQKEAYVNQLLSEIREEAPDYQDYVVDTIFLGGGTPSALPGVLIASMIGEIKKQFQVSEQAEISMECNPGTVAEEDFLIYRKAGINRISFGLQSSEEEDLRTLGRIHSYETFLISYQAARKAGFQNINIDLMTSLPGQSWESFLTVLQKVSALEPEHLSVYSLILEEGTRLYQMYEEEKKEGLKALPSEEEDRRIYHKTKGFLEKAGYKRYEISNYAKEGFACRHNLKYWTREEYLGLGLGASSMVNNCRWHRNTNLNDYLKGIHTKEEWEKLTQEECMSEYMFLGLRLMKGICIRDFNQIFGKEPEEVYASVIEKHIHNHLLMKKDGYLFLTQKGIDVSNYVMSDFVS